MGYETVLIIGYECGFTFAPDWPEELGRNTVLTIATVDLSKVGYDSFTAEVLIEARESGTTFYGTYYDTDGDGTLTEDQYGDKITAVDPDALIAAMERDQQEDGEYRRFTLALAILKTFRDDPLWKGEKLRVLQYGH